VGTVPTYGNALKWRGTVPQCGDEVKRKFIGGMLLMVFIRQLQVGICHTWASCHFYQELKTKTTNPVYQRYIEQAEGDKRKHYELLQYAYYLQTGEYHTLENEKRTSSSFREGVHMALKDELKEASIYRDLLMEAPGWEVYQPLFIVMTDAPRNAVRFSCIYNALK
jgi:rubrerythrin